MATERPNTFVTNLPAGAGMRALGQAAADFTDLPRGH
jgi:hypothetical protein